MRHHGFTWLEAMILVAVAVLAFAILRPGYGDYPERTRVGEALQAGADCRIAVTEAWSDAQGQLPDLRTLCSPPRPSKYAQAVKVTEHGAIVVVVGNTGHAQVDGMAIRLTPLDEDGSPKNRGKPGHLQRPIAAWRCGPDMALPMPLKYLPGSCRG